MLIQNQNFFTFRDTILLTIDFDKNKNVHHHVLLGIAEWLRPAILSGLENGILWRGAVSIGEYVHNEKIAIGPAIAYAAKWYEKQEMLRVIATPTCGTYLKLLEEQIRINKLNKQLEGDFNLIHFFIEYEVPLKDNKYLKLWTVSWPQQFMFDIENLPKDYSPLRMFYDLLKEFSIDFSTEIKYINTEKFFKDYLKSMDKE